MLNESIIESKRRINKGGNFGKLPNENLFVEYCPWYWLANRGSTIICYVEPNLHWPN